MKLRIIVDECVDLRIFKDAPENDYDFIFISKEHSGISDLQVIQLAEESSALIVTEDKDFGEWVFSHHKEIGVIFLRFSSNDILKIKKSLFNIINKYQDKLLKFFTVISVKKIRMREI